MSKVLTTAKTRPTRKDAQRQAILDAASRLFIEKGFGGTNFNDIADAVGVTRTALYYYFTNKDIILAALTEEVTEKAGQLARTVGRREELSPSEALRQLIQQHVGLILSHPIQFRVVERSESSLPESGRIAAENARRAVLENFVHVIQRGIDANEFHRTDAKISAFMIIGMSNWCAWWFDPEGTLPANNVATMIADFSLRALSVKKTKSSARPPDLQDAAFLMSQAFAVLETHIKNSKDPPTKPKR